MSQNSQKFQVLRHRRTELTQVPGMVQKGFTCTPGIVAQAYRTHRRSRYGYERHTELTEVPGIGTEVVHSSQKFRVLWHRRTNSQKFRVGRKKLYTYAGYCGTGVQNVEQFRVRV